MEELDKSKRRKFIVQNYDKPDQLILSLPAEFKEAHNKNVNTFEKTLNGPPSKVRQIADSSMERLMEQFILDRKQEREMFVHQLVAENKNLPRPLGNIDITVCNILGSKGLGADGLGRPNF